jgi:uncharacterized protein with FMN-binding domain
MPKKSPPYTTYISIICIVVIVALGVWQYMSTNIGTKVTPSTGTDQTQGVTPTTPTSTTVSTTTGIYRDGTYTGDASNTIYGVVQVKVIVKNGQLADVQYLQYPNDRENSLKLSQKAMSVLKQEAITLQSASVDTVSGATQTTDGFRSSLASALAQAKI